MFAIGLARSPREAHGGAATPTRLPALTPLSATSARHTYAHEQPNWDARSLPGGRRIAGEDGDQPGRLLDRNPRASRVVRMALEPVVGDAGAHRRLTAATTAAVLVARGDLDEGGTRPSQSRSSPATPCSVAGITISTAITNSLLSFILTRHSRPLRPPHPCSTAPRLYLHTHFHLRC